MNAETAGHVGTPQLKQFHMVNIKMVFYHPKKYKELHGLTSLKCNTRQRAPGSLPANGASNSDQVISPRVATASARRAPGPGLKSQAPSSTKEQASSTKLQAFEPTCSIAKRQASQSE